MREMWRIPRECLKEAQQDVTVLVIRDMERAAGARNLRADRNRRHRLRNIDVEGWTALPAPAGTPKAIVERLNWEVNLLLADADFKTRINGRNLYFYASTSPAQLADFMVKGRQDGAAPTIRAHSRRACWPRLVNAACGTQFLAGWIGYVC